MQKLIVLVMVVGLLVGGCAGLQKACEQGAVIKAKIRAALQIAQVGYPLVVAMAGASANPEVQYRVSLIDASLDLLGRLAFDLACPDLVELNLAQSALEQALDAKAALGVQ